MDPRAFCDSTSAFNNMNQTMPAPPKPPVKPFYSQAYAKQKVEVLRNYDPNDLRSLPAFGIPENIRVALPQTEEYESEGFTVTKKKKTRLP